ncbi:MAG: HD domain-containing protein [Fibrobacter sp.]|nr:HD domain-containing protein [Fibrobacter sp.]
MIIAYLTILCVISAYNVVLLYRINPKQKGPYPCLFFFAFISCVGHLFLALSTNVDEVILANKINYLGSVFTPLMTFDAILLVCNVRFPQWGRSLLLVLSFVVLGLSLTVGYSDIYYKTVEFVTIYGVGNYVATYGPGHDLFNVMLFGYAFSNVALIVYAFAKKKNVSYKNLVVLSLIELVSILSFFGSRFLATDTLVMPMVYVFDQWALLYICFRVKRYDIVQTVQDVLEEKNTDGYLSISSSLAFLGGNDIAIEYFPEFKECRVDHELPDSSEVTRFFRNWVLDVKTGQMDRSREYEQGTLHFKCSMKIVAVSSKLTLLLFKIEEDTEFHRYVKMLGNDNSRLESMVKDNANQIQAIQEQMIIGMANMVESRDRNTGGHIKRTSTVISILVEELRKNSSLSYDDAFYEGLVKSAPMHDLGKIAIDDAVLRKPGRFTPEEYDAMKTHPVKGAAIVENLLSQIEEPSFVQIAKNVAWFHHERFDGKGYPNGLKGEEIPFEARVMAVADVYDALVSKRCYKEKFSFEDAYDIIEEGMGSQFDPSLRAAFEQARPRLEGYYRGLEPKC